MKYQFKDVNYYNFNVYEENKLAGRSYFIPYPNKAEVEKIDILKERYSSSKVECLNGEWDFLYYEKSSLLNKQIDSDNMIWDKVQVPHMWQMTGYERPFYVNCKYQFLLSPDKSIPHDDENIGVRGLKVAYNSLKKKVDMYNSVGLYRKNFSIDNLDKTFIISFLGVMSSLELYINGEYVGYSEGAHNTAEFDLTKFINKGNNELVAIVHKFSNGSYLECQDMFRHNGIFRDVLLYINDKEYIHNFDVKTRRIGLNNFDLDVTLDIKNPSGKINLSLVDKVGKIVAKSNLDAKTNLSYSFKNLNVKEWNAEVPELYTLFIGLEGESEKECIRQQIGFVEVKIEGDLFLVNGKAIKIKGVNHHDTHPTQGYYLTPKDIEKDVLLMKEYNMNGVRTSHYPPDALMLQLCNLYGIYVIDEADIECHGVNAEFPFNYDYIADDLAWKEHFNDRVNRLFQRDKNNASVVMWSLGNEAGGYKCHDYCYDNLKKLSSIPIHYEGAIRTKRGSYDVISDMYPSVGHIEKVGLNQHGNKLKYPANKPYYLCEYAHAMGLGPGELEDYWTTILKHDKLMGGCIWEMIDHAILNKDGNYKWTYGGDHGEFVHDGNFCVDGLFYPDRKPHPGAINMKSVYRPIRSRIENGALVFNNTNVFKNSEYISIKYKAAMINGDFKEGEFNIAIPPKADAKVEFDSKGIYGLNIYYTDKKTKAEIATEYLQLNEMLFKKEIIESKTDVSFTETSDGVKVSTKDAEIVFDKKSGLRSYIYFGKNLLAVESAKTFYTGIFRPEIDNDNKRFSWRKAGYDKYEMAIGSVKASKQANGVVVTISGKLKHGIKSLFKFEDKYLIGFNGSMTVTSKIKGGKMLPELPKFGKNIVLSQSFSNVNYLGMGKIENYSDMKSHAIFDHFSSSVEDMYEPYIRPQEFGNHTNTHYLTITDKENNYGILIQAISKSFNFSARKYSVDKINKAGHIEDLSRDNTYLNIDSFMRGVGSASCGPHINKKYTQNAGEELSFSFAFTPFYNSIK